MTEHRQTSIRLSTSTFQNARGRSVFGARRLVMIDDVGVWASEQQRIVTR